MSHRIRTAIQVLALLLMGMVTGAMFGIWAGYNPAGFAAATFVEAHQGSVRGLNLLLPVMGFLSIALTVALAIGSRAHRRTFWLYAGAALLTAVAGLVTRFANQPINDIVMTWSAAAPPADWTILRDNWWTWHPIRLAAGFVAYVLLILGCLSDRAAAAVVRPSGVQAGAWGRC